MVQELQELTEFNEKKLKSTTDKGLNLAQRRRERRSRACAGMGSTGESNSGCAWTTSRGTTSETERSSWFTFSEVVNKHICESTRELAEDLRDVTKVLGSVGREVAWLSISTGEFGEDFEVRFVV